MAKPNTKLPTDQTVKQDFKTGTVQPGPGMAPDKPPAEDMRDPGASEEFQMPKGTDKQSQPSAQPKSSAGGCGCG